MPTLDNEWMDADTNEIGVRQHYVLMDALKEGHKIYHSNLMALTVEFLRVCMQDTV